MAFKMWVFLRLQSCLKVLKARVGFLLPEAVAEVTAEPGSGVAACERRAAQAPPAASRRRVRPARGKSLQRESPSVGFWLLEQVVPLSAASARVGMLAWER